MTAAGVFNPNSRLKDWDDVGISLPEFPLPIEIRIRNLEIVIQANKNIWLYNYRIGNRIGARAQARLICEERAELRWMKLGI